MASLYHNYKGFFSVVMMSLVDTKYRFRWVDMVLRDHAQMHRYSTIGS